MAPIRSQGAAARQALPQRRAMPPRSALEPGNQAFERLEEFARVASLLNRANGARGAQFALQLGRVERRVEDDGDILGGAALFQELSQIDSSQGRHVDVEQDDIRMKFRSPLRGAEGFLASVYGV